MNTDVKKEAKTDKFIIEYNDLISKGSKTVIIDLQWKNEGDFFKETSIYDNTYLPVKTLGSTTLINHL